MAESFKVAVLGPVPRDHITTHEGTVVDKYGCGLNAVAALMGGGGEVALVTHMRQVDHGRVVEILSRLPGAGTLETLAFKETAHGGGSAIMSRAPSRAGRPREQVAALEAVGEDHRVQRQADGDQTIHSRARERWLRSRPWVASAGAV